MEAIKDKTKVFINLKNLSGEEIKEAIEPIEDYLFEYDGSDGFKFLHLIASEDMWFIDCEKPCKTEINLSEFRQLFSKAEISDYPGKDYQELFNHLQNEHGLTLLESEMSHIIRIASKGEEVLKFDNDLLKSSLILLGMFTELDAEIKTEWSQEQINAVQYISDKSNN